MPTLQASNAPHYQRLKQYIRGGIAQGVWPTLARVPSEGDLTRLFGVSRMTANRALRELTSEGLITRIQGVGSFVAAAKTEATMIEVRGIREEICSRGQVYSARVIAHHAMVADEATGSRLGLTEGATVFHSRIVHCANGEPLQLEDRFVNRAMVPLYLKQDLRKTTPHEYLMAIAPLERAEHVIEATLPDRATAQQLELDPKAPVLVLNRRTWSQGRAVSLARLVYPASRFQFVGQFNVDPSAASSQQPAHFSSAIPA